MGAVNIFVDSGAISDVKGFGMGFVRVTIFPNPHGVGRAHCNRYEIVKVGVLGINEKKYVVLDSYGGLILAYCGYKV